MAREKKCVCGCGGKYHGKGRHQINPEYEFILDEKLAEKIRGQYDPKRTHCLCGYDLQYEDIIYYKPHESGWKIPGETELVWLYVKCPLCGYDMAIWKMGVPRNYEC